MVGAGSSSGDQADVAVKSIRDTARWVVAGLAGIATAITAGSQLSSIGALEVGGRLALAIGAAVVALLAVGAGIWVTIDVLLPAQVGLAELADESNKSNRSVRDYIKAHLELLQGCAANVGDLNQEYQRSVADRDRKYAASEADPGKKEVEAAAVAANDKVAYLLAVSESLLRFAILQEVRLRFASWRPRIALIAVVVALAVLTFAWAANPPKSTDSTSLAGATLSNAVLVGADLRNVDLSGADLRNANLRGANLTGAKLGGVQWAGAICPDGRKADDVGGSCAP